MYLIIVGAGDIGSQLIGIATQDNNDVVVIEKDAERAERASVEFDCLVLHNDATILDTLEEAGANRADALISTTDQDATNIMVCLLGQELEIPSLVSVVHNTEHMSIFRQLGVNVIENPQRLIANYLYRAVKRPSIKDYMKVGKKAEVFEITVDSYAPIAGLTLSDAADDGLFDEGMLVVAIDRENEVITPHGNTKIEGGDVVTVFSENGATPKVTDIFGHYEDHG
ncbi:MULTISPECIES: TrkA family potassium uptake protein [unclassified Haladaptatus]|uniref:potassium channel family protein n=1 Tax=unclassified Haladaptatus TaxID=2622732 RepID=UPI00209C2AA4|nr:MULTISPECIES: TrkA family potassium uptake protein [unclassified Haladaptatus]MCO8243172.1 TrkA family potassium uptake protein [Haladaptatus sp. AB643]MCO8252884.1 TrkA family potassium uptake protein [Haladaptatus sp. AB618]